ncbi:hypothetical protein Pla175_20800 [Pirellulimonas nuda]|uniref:Uncharacterized protein n=1 Tax=Pirellulimonas nuda TaxID=2528009 RepID=A0A518DB39_9BACT|nr:hypothetical protein [Pirellulimonas nuda]QDU88699.1 hypothetical protein Pla175_20800 [Pirellulimonas nuda]
MGNRIFSSVVILSWGCSMAWLMTAKIMPAFGNGEPPHGGSGAQIPVAWSIEIAGHPCGTAVTQSVAGIQDTTEVHSRVILNELPLPAIAPEWMSSLVGKLGEVSLDMRTKTTLDPLKKLSSFETNVDLNDVPDVVRMYGKVLKGSLRLQIRTGELSRTSQYPWPNEALLGGELTPEPQLLQAYVGRTWKREVYSPFASPHNPVELLEAEVVEETKISFNGELTAVRLIVYRSMSSAGVSSEDRIRAKLWVGEDGRVLRQEVRLMKTRLRFDRLPNAKAKRLASEKLELATRSAVNQPADKRVTRPRVSAPQGVGA